VAALGVRPDDEPGPPTVLVTHHVEEIPVGTTHALLLRAGRVVDQGPIDAVLTAEALGDTFGLPLELERRGDRFSAWGRDP
jgi:iron complex transport system ATP-binding protein